MLIISLIFDGQVSKTVLPVQPPIMPTSITNRYLRPTLLPSVLLLSHAPGIRAIHRSIGALDPRIKAAVDTCFALPNQTFNGLPIGYAAGKCPNLINCIMGNLAAADQVGLSAGTSIACLLPTILALVGERTSFIYLFLCSVCLLEFGQSQYSIILYPHTHMPVLSLWFLPIPHLLIGVHVFTASLAVGASPLELVQLGLTSPLRAAATCLFGVGLPSGLFRQLRTASQVTGGHSEIQETRNPCSRTWQIYIPQGKATKTDIVRRILADIVIVGLAAVMVWRK
jgi:hypothetical protein